MVGTTTRVHFTSLVHVTGKVSDGCSLTSGWVSQPSLVHWTSTGLYTSGANLFLTCCHTGSQWRHFNQQVTSARSDCCRLPAPDCCVQQNHTRATLIRVHWTGHQAMAGDQTMVPPLQVIPLKLHLLYRLDKLTANGQINNNHKANRLQNLTTPVLTFKKYNNHIILMKERLLRRESKKGCHPNHGYNYVNSWSICKILSLLQTAVNFQQNPYWVTHHTLSMLLHYLELPRIDKVITMVRVAPFFWLTV